MDFPAWPPTKIEAESAVAEALGVPVQWTGRTDNEVFLLVLVADEGSVRGLSPDLAAVGRLDASAVIVTAAADPDREYDFVSRLFAPNLGIPEDPVTGSSHTVLAPFWADRLGRTLLVGLQASSRSGLVGVELNGDRVTIIGRAITVFDGTLTSVANPT
jgi:predicted PhzF superfamily epimerase YddE/YHI9